MQRWPRSPTGASGLLVFPLLLARERFFHVVQQPDRSVGSHAENARRPPVAEKEAATSSSTRHLERLCNVSWSGMNRTEAAAQLVRRFRQPAKGIGFKMNT